MPYNQTFFSPTPQYGKRAMHATSWHEGQAYHIGGRRDPYDFRDAWRTANGDPAGLWLQLMGPEAYGANIWPHRSYISAQSFNGLLHFVGGFNSDYQYYMVGGHYAYANGGRDVTKFPEPPFEAREAYGLAANADVMLLSGGVTYKPPIYPTNRAFSDVWAFDKEGRWSLVLEDAPWGEIRSHGWEWLNGYWYLWGGHNSTDAIQNKLWRWDGVNAPEEMDPLPVATGVSITCTANGKLWNICGNAIVNGVAAEIKSVYSYDPSTDQWTQHNDFPSEERKGGRALVVPGTPDKIFVFGGMKGTSPGRTFHVDVHSTADGDTWDAHTSCTLYGGT